MKPVDYFLDTAISFSENVSSCWGVTILSLMQSTRLSKIDLDSMFMMPRALQLLVFVCFGLECHDLGLRCPTVRSKGTVCDVAPLVAKPTCASPSSFGGFSRLTLSPSMYVPLKRYSLQTGA